MFVLTGSAADKVCYEYGQGLLTYSILQFMKTLVTQGDRPVDVMNLFRNNKPLAAAPDGRGGQQRRRAGFG
jgi:hypothetical protein